MGSEALKPSQLVIEFRSGLRIPIGEVDGCDQDSLNRRFNVASLMIFRISRQTCASQHGNVMSRENGHAVPRALPLPDCFAPESPKGVDGKGFPLRLELLKTHTSGSAFANQARRLSSRSSMLLMLNVATFTNWERNQIPVHFAFPLPRPMTKHHTTCFTATITYETPTTARYYSWTKHDSILAETLITRMDMWTCRRPVLIPPSAIPVTRRIPTGWATALICK